MNAHPEEWLGSSKTNLHGRTAHNFASTPGCEQMVTEPAHIDRGVFDLMLTDVPDVVGIQEFSLACQWKPQIIVPFF